MFRRSKPYWLSVAAVAVILLALAAPATTLVSRADGNPNPGIVPNNAKYRTLSAQWWQWALAAPPAVNPVIDPTGAHCAQGQGDFSNHNVWFLAGTFGGPATRSCTIPPGKSLFFPILNSAWACELPPAFCEGVEVLRANAAADMNNPTLLEASIDGVPVQALESYRATSPVFSIELLFGAAGPFEPAVADGYWLLVTPRTPGSHTIHFKGIRHDGFETEVTYNLTVGH